VFDYLLNEFALARNWWTFKRLRYVFRECLLTSDIWVSGLVSLLTGRTLEGVFSSHSVRGRLRIIEDVFDPLINVHGQLPVMAPSQPQKTLGQLAWETLLKQPYIGTAFFNIVKGYYYAQGSFVSKFVTNEQQRGAVLKEIRRTVFKEDILQMCYELRLQVAIEELF